MNSYGRETLTIFEWCSWRVGCWATTFSTNTEPGKHSSVTSPSFDGGARSAERPENDCRGRALFEKTACRAFGSL